MKSLLYQILIYPCGHTQRGNLFCGIQRVQMQMDLYKGYSHKIKETWFVRYCSLAICEWHAGLLIPPRYYRQRISDFQNDSLQRVMKYTEGIYQASNIEN